MDIPACARWRPATDGQRAEAFNGSDLMSIWQRGRCAECGTDREKLVLDHDHTTGFIRGFLCSRCNTLEGFGHLVEYTGGRNPAVLLGVEEVYVSSWGHPAIDRSPTADEASQMALAMRAQFTTDTGEAVPFTSLFD